MAKKIGEILPGSRVDVKTQILEENQSSAKEDFTDSINPPFKFRLDAIARLITGDGVVGAVCPYNGKIYASHNQSTDATRFLIKQCQAFFEMLKEKESMKGNELLQDKEVIAKMDVIVNSSINTQLLGKDQQTIKEAKKKLSKRFNKVVKAFAVDAIEGVDGFPKDVKDALASKWEYVEPKPKTIKHAEMHVLDGINKGRDKLKKAKLYLGISKLCCRDCSIMIKNFNEKYKERGGFIERRGTHGTQYRPWLRPDFAKVNQCDVYHPAPEDKNLQVGNRDQGFGVGESPQSSPSVSPRGAAHGAVEYKEAVAVNDGYNEDEDYAEDPDLVELAGSKGMEGVGDGGDQQQKSRHGEDIGDGGSLVFNNLPSGFIPMPEDLTREMFMSAGNQGPSSLPDIRIQFAEWLEQSRQSRSDVEARGKVSGKYSHKPTPAGNKHAEDKGQSRNG